MVLAADLAKKWKRTKSLTTTVEKLRKGLSVDVDGRATAALEVKVDEEKACICMNDSEFHVRLSRVSPHSCSPPPPSSPS